MNDLKLREKKIDTLRRVLASHFGTAIQDMAASRLSSVMVTLCAAPSLGIVIVPGTSNVALTFPLEVTIAGVK